MEEKEYWFDLRGKVLAKDRQDATEKIFWAAWGEAGLQVKGVELEEVKDNANR